MRRSFIAIALLALGLATIAGTGPVAALPDDAPASAAEIGQGLQQARAKFGAAIRGPLSRNDDAGAKKAFLDFVDDLTGWLGKMRAYLEQKPDAPDIGAVKQELLRVHVERIRFSASAMDLDRTMACYEDAEKDLPEEQFEPQVRIYVGQLMRERRKDGYKEFYARILAKERVIYGAALEGEDVRVDFFDGKGPRLLFFWESG